MGPRSVAPPLCAPPCIPQRGCRRCRRHPLFGSVRYYVQLLVAAVVVAPSECARAERSSARRNSLRAGEGSGGARAARANRPPLPFGGVQSRSPRERLCQLPAKEFAESVLIWFVLKSEIGAIKRGSAAQAAQDARVLARNNANQIHLPAIVPIKNTNQIWVRSLQRDPLHIYHYCTRAQHNTIGYGNGIA
jgi:hypothetical protein